MPWFDFFDLAVALDLEDVAAVPRPDGTSLMTRPAPRPAKPAEVSVPKRPCATFDVRGDVSAVSTATMARPTASAQPPPAAAPVPRFRFGDTSAPRTAPASAAHPIVKPGAADVRPASMRAFCEQWIM